MRRWNSSLGMYVGSEHGSVGTQYVDSPSFTMEDKGGVQWFNAGESTPNYDIAIKSANPKILLGQTVITEADVIAWKGHANDMVFFETIGVLFCFILLLVALFTPSVLTHQHLKEVKKLLKPEQK